MKIVVFFSAFLFLWNCGSGTQPVENTNSTANQPGSGQAGTVEDKKPETEVNKNAEPEKPTPGSQKNAPKTVREFFTILPEKYFTLEGCDKATDKNCNKARADYLKSFLEVEDTRNGYLKGGCDGAQECIVMALFKRPDGNYLVGVETEFEMGFNNYFLEYKNGSWSNVGASAVPDFSTNKIYELPRYGTTVKVFAKNITEKDTDYEFSEKGEKLYDLEWKDGQFTIKK